MQQKSPVKPHTGGYVRVCVDCGRDMQWIWGGEITYFQCDGCDRIEPCANVIIEPKKHTMTVADGNIKEVFAYRPDEFEEVLSMLSKAGSA